MSLSPKMAAVKTSVLNFFKGKTSVPVMQVPLATPTMQVAPVASRMDEDAHMPDMEGVIRGDTFLRNFKKEFEDLTCEYFAAVKRVGQHMDDSFLNAREPLEIQPDMVFTRQIFEGLMECLDENQRKVRKFFEDERSALVIAAAPDLKHLASTMKPAGESGKDERKTAEADAVPLACSAVPSFPVEGATRRRPRRKRRLANAVPSEKKGPTSDIRHGTIVGINHEKKFAFIRTSRDRNDFYVGQQQFDHRMAMGDEVSFCELEPRGCRRRCPGACHVDLLARAWSWYHRPYHGARKRSGS